MSEALGRLSMRVLFAAFDSVLTTTQSCALDGPPGHHDQAFQGIVLAEIVNYRAAVGLILNWQPTLVPRSTMALLKFFGLGLAAGIPEY